MCVESQGLAFARLLQLLPSLTVVLPRRRLREGAALASHNLKAEPPAEQAAPQCLSCSAEVEVGVKWSRVAIGVAA